MKKQLSCNIAHHLVLKEVEVINGCERKTVSECSECQFRLINHIVKHKFPRRISTKDSSDYVLHNTPCSCGKKTDFWME